jgi:hypothetical protein
MLSNLKTYFGQVWEKIFIAPTLLQMIADQFYEYNKGTLTWADVISTYQQYVNNSCVN